MTAKEAFEMCLMSLNYSYKMWEDAAHEERDPDMIKRYSAMAHAIKYEIDAISRLEESNAD